ncbi:MAG: hypothetical protein H7338_22120 [Candidatus Sericytochromatia bacterium]|nr:hypothetical protein [Candidatus Sericytochromatia bacterium]
MSKRVSAIFKSRSEAERVINELRTLGLNDKQLSLVTRHGSDSPLGNGDNVEDTTGKGLLAGAGLGALFGLASAFIPGVGPFVAAGALAATIGTVGASTVAGAVVGGATGALTGVLTKAGYPEQESRFYSEELDRGGVLVSTELDGADVPESQVRGIYSRHSGRMAPTVRV